MYCGLTFYVYDTVRSHCILLCGNLRVAPNRLCWQPVKTESKRANLRVNESSKKEHRNPTDGALLLAGTGLPTHLPMHPACSFRA